MVPAERVTAPTLNSATWYAERPTYPACKGFCPGFGVFWHLEFWRTKESICATEVRTVSDAENVRSSNEARKDVTAKQVRSPKKDNLIVRYLGALLYRERPAETEDKPTHEAD